MVRISAGKLQSATYLCRWSQLRIRCDRGPGVQVRGHPHPCENTTTRGEPGARDEVHTGTDNGAACSCRDALLICNLTFHSLKKKKPFKYKGTAGVVCGGACNCQYHCREATTISPTVLSHGFSLSERVKGKIKKKR
jgi:hypothetical protein